MDKSWYKSKTVQGITVFTVLGALQQLGVGDGALWVDTVQTLAVGWGAYGFRSALA